MTALPPTHSEPAAPPRPIVFVDVETDGLGPHCRAWEVALIRRDEHGEQEHHWFLPLDLRHADAKALEIGRFWDRHPAGRKVSGKTPDGVPCEPIAKTHDVARDIMRLTFGATLVGASVHFDADVLARLLRAEGYLPSWSHRLRCVTTLASGLAGEDLGGLDGAAKRWLVDVPEAGRHTALGDTRVARDLHDAVMRPTRRVLPGSALADCSVLPQSTFADTTITATINAADGTVIS